jgi:DNA mismatch endonuclease (patch repair protein)
VIPRLKLVIFVHGCFWHGHENCARGRLPKTRIEYWKNKIELNRKRDIQTTETLKSMGWEELVIWDCQLRTQKAASIILPNVLDTINLICASAAR